MKKTLLIIGALTSFSIGSVLSQSILAVDFNASFNVNSTTETGFQGFNALTNAGSANPSVTFGAYSVQLFGATVQGRYRSALTDTGAFTYNDLLEDLATNFTRTTTTVGNFDSTAAASTSLVVSGLAANTQYYIRLWSLDTGFNNNALQKWYNTTVGTGASAVLIGGTITNQTTPTLTDNTSYSTYGLVTSDNTGALRLGYVATAGNGVLNGFQITAVPEPTHVAVAFAAFAVLVVAIRRRQVRG